MGKILEAIQKGIQMGLEIQDDELDQSIFQRSEMTSNDHVDRANKIRYARENFVDLGLPSGTLWAKHNLGASCGDTPESWYGGYYSWGEVKMKYDYTWETYKYCNGSEDTLTKYDAKDRKEVLDPEDDVVSVALCKDFRMPTKEDFEELFSLPSKWVKKYNGIKGLRGRVFTGNNGNQLFIPASGYRYKSNVADAGVNSYLWSSSRSFVTHEACSSYFNANHIYPFNHYNRYYGQTVRAVA